MQSQRTLSTFPIAPVHKTKLCAAGFLTVEDLKDIKPSSLSKGNVVITVEDLKDIKPSGLSKGNVVITVEDLKDIKPSGLSKETGIGLEECLEIIKLVNDDTTKKSTVKSAFDILQQEQTLPPIITFSEQIDAMLGGGVPLCKITEFCGAPGIGKTQMCMQLAVDVQIPECFGGLDGEVVYIDTEGSFIVERLVDVTTATIQHCQQISQMESDEETKSSMSQFTTEKVLSRIHYYRCHDYVELLATVHLLPDFIKDHPKVKLVVVDSIAFHFRHDFDDFSLRTRLLTSMAQSFIKLATEYKIAVVLTNQMTTKVKHGESSQLVPALGESWGHASTVRVILYWEGQQRYAWLYKSPSKKESTVPYQVTMGGIRDIVESQECDKSEHNLQQPAKRQRVT
ncbi:RAD51-like protein 2 [Mytilus galloprovincialis]|uniref:DNA repair protein RAD51 homolog 3 n=1 Tax=Mytilus galloprovincialis TaxID=29158 RepID=A0A8B6HFA0_MYTGA|nr:RAD51-like protein 2 [Mytilus galloprovincialis]